MACVSEIANKSPQYWNCGDIEFKNSKHFLNDYHIEDHITSKESNDNVNDYINEDNDEDYVNDDDFINEEPLGHLWIIKVLL